MLPFRIAAALLVLWLVAETVSRVYAGSKGGSTSARIGADRGSFFGILLANYISVGVAFGFYVNAVGPSLPYWFIGVGAAVAVAGVVLRAWAIATFGRFFSVVIRIEADHRLVETGPYRWIRHPSYTGMLLSLWGVALVLGTVAGLLSVVLATGLAFSYRIAVEERMLRERFGSEYDAYARRTGRLFPRLP